jgi:hypothetical protein
MFRSDFADTRCSTGFVPNGVLKGYHICVSVKIKIRQRHRSNTPNQRFRLAHSRGPSLRAHLYLEALHFPALRSG